MSTKKKYIYSSLLFLFVVMGLYAFLSSDNELDSGTIKVALRNIGHELLLQNEDSISLVEPILETTPKCYRVSFQNSLSIEPSFLEKSITSSLNEIGINTSYRAEVIQCFSHEVVYSYEFKIKNNNSLVPCQGRTLPNGCYKINVTFLEKKSSSTPFYIVGFSFLVFFVFGTEHLLSKRKSNSERNIVEVNNDNIKIGSFEFNPKQNKMVRGNSEISLSKKECELLFLFTENLNEIITRDELTKRIWEDNGVFVGRSLDTYISKLRKKIQQDSNVKLINIHGVGYKLEIEN